MNAAVPAPPLYETISPTLRWLLTVCIMMATIMQALDTTIANVALPYMQGSLSTTQDQINWVLTSYIVAAAIMTSPLGWMAMRVGRKKLFIVCTAGFTVASMLCGIAQSIEQMRKQLETMQSGSKLNTLLAMDSRAEVERAFPR